MSDKVVSKFLTSHESVSEADALQYGVLGMKWGVRRPRGKDGLVVRNKKAKKLPAKKPRVEQRKAKKLPAKKSRIDSRMAKKLPAQRPAAKSSVELMSDDQLRERLARIDLERRYTEAISSLTPKKQRPVRDLLVSSGSQVAKNVITQVGTQYISKALQVQLNKALPSAYRPTKQKK